MEIWRNGRGHNSWDGPSTEREGGSSAQKKTNGKVFLLQWHKCPPQKIWFFDASTKIDTGVVCGLPRSCNLLGVIYGLSKKVQRKAMEQFIIIRNEFATHASHILSIIKGNMQPSCLVPSHHHRYVIRITSKKDKNMSLSCFLVAAQPWSVLLSTIGTAERYEGG